MKNPLFVELGENYTIHLEEKYGRILTKIVELWEKPELHDYFSDLLIDKRGGRKGFPTEVLNEIIALREFWEFETFRAAENKEEAIQELHKRGIELKRENFLLALRDGDPERVDLFVRANINIHITDENNTPLLLAALRKGHTVIAKILLEAGADVNTRDKLGLSPLLVACGKTTQGYRSIAEALIKKGAMINVRDTLGFTPLLLALTGGNLDLAKLLIERGADLTVSTRKGESALSLAEKIQSPEGAEIVDLLKSKLAKPQ